MTRASQRHHDRDLPGWWTPQHPQWCHHDHRDDDAVCDRGCYSDWFQQIYPSLPDAACTVNAAGHRRIHSVDELHVYLKQGYRECEPRVSLTPLHTGDGEGIDMTRDEAYQLGNAMLAAVALLDAQPGPRIDSRQRVDEE